MARTREGYYSELARNLSFKELLEKINDRQKAVYNIICLYGPIYSEQIAMHLNIYPHQVSPRVLELRQMGLIEYAGKRRAGGCNKEVCFWRKKERVEVPEQERLCFEGGEG